MQEYLGRLGQGLLYCYRCAGWHDAGAFGPDRRRPSGRAGSCLRSVREARQARIRRAVPSPAAGPAPAAASAVWVVKRRAPSPGPDSGEADWYWRGPAGGAAGNRQGAWSPALDETVARFPAITEARDELIAAFGGTGTVPPGCRLARLA
ncbi:MAG: hypothetical protein ACRDNT_01365 [Streptosporangiaceae bacterium]